MSQITQHEDAAFKVMVQFFAEELMERFGIEGKVSSIAPTESVYLELKKLYNRGTYRIAIRNGIKIKRREGVNREEAPLVLSLGYLAA